MVEAHYKDLSHRICDNLLSHNKVLEAHTVHVYWPVTDQRETDIRPAIAMLIDMGKEIILPVVESFSRRPTNQPRMRHVRLIDVQKLVPNRWGIMEPGQGPSVDPDEIDLVIVPAKAIDGRGSRLGHGFGYYDEFLRPQNAITVCPIFDFARVKFIPVEPHDVRIAYTVTESAIWDNYRT